MKAVAMIIAVCGMFVLSVSALPPVRSTLPSVAYVDTETVTNVPFVAWQENAGRFAFSLTCRNTPTNNVQAAFGTDVDGDGVLSLEESDLVVGWDCGVWFVQNGFDGERIESVAGTGDEQTFLWTAPCRRARQLPGGWTRPLAARRCLEAWTPGCSTEGRGTCCA